MLALLSAGMAGTHERAIYVIRRAKLPLTRGTSVQNSAIVIVASAQGFIHE